MLRVNDISLNRALSAKGFKQNTDKKVMVPMLIGPGSDKAVRWAVEHQDWLAAKVVKAGRYLGGMYMGTGQTTVERKKRAEAARVGMLVWEGCGGGGPGGWR